MYWKIPKSIWKFKVSTDEMFYYQYLPIKMKWNHFINIEERLECFEDIIDSVISDYQKEFWYVSYSQKYIYLTAKRMYIKPNKTFNRWWWHSDWFWTDDINYLWSDCNPTIFNNSDFILSYDHSISMKEMEEQAKEENNFIYPDSTLIRLDQYSIHRVADTNEVQLRNFLKISFSDDKYDLEWNSHNYLIDYKWEMRSRWSERNVPQSINNPSLIWVTNKR